MPPFSSSWVLSLKMALVPACVLSVTLIFKLSAPAISDFVVTELPAMWNFVLSWLRPPYLFILINCIIISIVVSSKLQSHKPVHVTVEVIQQPYAIVTPDSFKFVEDVRSDCAAYNGVVSSGYGCDTSVTAKVMEVQQVKPIPDLNAKMDDGKNLNSRVEVGSYGTVSETIETGFQRKSSIDFQFEKENEKPPPSARFAHRRAIKSSPEGGKGPLGVSKPKRQETLENTWKTITEGRSMPLTRHLRKSETWDREREPHVRRPLDDRNGTPPPSTKMKKSETFSERSAEESNSSASPGSGKLMKEPSLSQDELNRRVEAFIRKFNEEMRMQRQASLNQYQEIVSRGGH